MHRTRRRVGQTWARIVNICEDCRGREALLDARDTGTVKSARRRIMPARTALQVHEHQTRRETCPDSMTAHAQNHPHPTTQYGRAGRAARRAARSPRGSWGRSKGASQRLPRKNRSTRRRESGVCHTTFPNQKSDGCTLQPIALDSPWPFPSATRRKGWMMADDWRSAKHASLPKESEVRIILEGAVVKKE